MVLFSMKVIRMNSFKKRLFFPHFSVLLITLFIYVEISNGQELPETITKKTVSTQKERIEEESYYVAQPGQNAAVIQESGGELKLIKRNILLSNPGKFEIPGEQLHFPYVFESPNGIWYMTYREGPHFPGKFGDVPDNNRVQCIQSWDQGKTWLPWMGLKPEKELYQFFITRLKDGTLITYRLRLENMHKTQDGTTKGTTIIYRSVNDGATWKRQTASVTGLPYTIGQHLVSLWGTAIEMPDGRLIWGVISREGNSLAGVVESTDKGNSWRYLASLCDDPTVGERREPGLVMLESGELLAVLRTGLSPTLRMVEVRSLDGGRSWSTPTKLPWRGVSPQLLLLDNGVLILSFGTRNALYITASWDGIGNNWSKPLLVYQGETSGYSNLQKLAENSFRVVYAESSFLHIQEGGNRIVRLEFTAAPAKISTAIEKLCEE